MGTFDISFPAEGGSSSYTYNFNGECEGNIDSIRFTVSESWIETAKTDTETENIKKITISAEGRTEQETDERAGYVYTYLNETTKCINKTFTVIQSGHESGCGCEELATYPNFITVNTVPSSGLTNRKWYNIGELHLENLSEICQNLQVSDFEFYVTDNSSTIISKYKITVVEQDGVKYIRLSMRDESILDIGENITFVQSYLFSLTFNVKGNVCENIKYSILQEGQIPCDCTSIGYFVTMWRSSYSTDGNTVRDFNVDGVNYTLIGSGNTLSCGYLEAESQSIIFENQKIYTKIDEQDDSKVYFYGIITKKEDPEAGGDSTDVAIRFRKKTQSEFDPNCKMTFPVIREVDSCDCDIFNRSFIEHYGRSGSLYYPEKVKCDGDLSGGWGGIASFSVRGEIEDCPYLLAKVDENCNWVHNVRSQKGSNNNLYIMADIDATTSQRSVEVTIDKYINLMVHHNGVWKPVEELMPYGYVIRVIDGKLVVGDSITSPVYDGPYIGYPCGSYNFTLTQDECRGCECNELDIHIYQIAGGEYINDRYNFSEDSYDGYEIKLTYNESCGNIDGNSIRISDGKVYDEDGITEASWGHIELWPNNENAKKAFLVLNQNDESDNNGYVELTIISDGNECKTNTVRIKQYGTFDCNNCSHLLREIRSTYHEEITFNQNGEYEYSLITLIGTHHECVDVTGITCNENGEYVQYNWLTLSHSTMYGESINIAELPSGLNERIGYVKGILLSNESPINCGDFPFITKITQRREQETCNCDNTPSSWNYNITVNSANNGSGTRQIGTFSLSEPLKDCLTINIVSTQYAPNGELYAEPSLGGGTDRQNYTINVKVNNEEKPLSPSGTPLDELPIGFTINIIYEGNGCKQININEQFKVIWPNN